MEEVEAAQVAVQVVQVPEAEQVLTLTGIMVRGIRHPQYLAEIIVTVAPHLLPVIILVRKKAEMDRMAP